MIARFSIVLFGLFGVQVFLLISRTDVAATVLRTPGQIFQTLPDGHISNLYNIKLANKSRRDIPVALKLENISGELQVVGKPIVVAGESYFQASFFVKLKKEQLVRRKTELVIGVYVGGKMIETTKNYFYGPGILILFYLDLVPLAV